MNSLTFIKVLNEEECHHCLQYHEGLNTCPDYQPTPECGHGIHYTDTFNFTEWISLGNHYREVLSFTNPIQIDKTKWKAETVTLGPRKEFVELFPTKEAELAIVSKNGYIIEYIKDPSEKLQLAAVKEMATKECSDK